MIRFAIIFTLLLTLGCDVCENKVLKEVVLDGKKAVVFERNCGATTPFNTQLSILGSDDQLPDDGSNVVALPERGRIAEVVWESSTQLAVHITDGKSAFRKLDSFDGVKVRYVTVTKPNP